jgi:hypothetical protein
MRRNDWLTLCGLLAVALALRLWVAWTTAYLIHPDEAFDYLDQGYRLAFGHGWTTWTYQYGLRSTWFPAAIGLVMRITAAFNPAPYLGVKAVTGVMSVLSLTLVVAAWQWGRRAGGWLGGTVTGFLTAVWFELIYFAPHTLSETIATDALVLGALLADAPLAQPRPRRLVAAGLLLGLAFYQRVQLTPAITVIVLWLLVSRGWRSVRWLLAGAVVPVVALGLLDMIDYGYPFQSIFLYFWANTKGGVSAYYGGQGHQPFYYILSLEASYQAGALAVLLLTAALGAWQQPCLALIALAILVPHSLIALKEYRFFYPALPFLCVLSGIGTTRIIRLFAAPGARLATVGLCLAALVFWSLTSASLALEGPFKREWVRSAGAIALARQLAVVPDLCGVGVYGMPGSATAGFSLVGRDVPYYAISWPDRFAIDANSFNAVIAYDSNLPPGGGFTRLGCWANGYNEASMNERKPHMCLLVRPGTCAPGAVNDTDTDRPPQFR